MSGDLAVCAEADLKIWIWKHSTGAHLQTLHVVHSVAAVAVCASANIVVAGDPLGNVWVWDSNTRAVLQTLEGHTKAVASVAVSAGGDTIVSGSLDGTGRVWHADRRWVRRGIFVPAGTLDGHTKAVTCVAVSGDGWTVASGSVDRTVRTWNTFGGAFLSPSESRAQGESFPGWFRSSVPKTFCHRLPLVAPEIR